MNLDYTKLHEQELVPGTPEWTAACVKQFNERNAEFEAELAARGFVTDAPRLQTIPFDQLQIGDPVYSAWTGTHGKIATLTPNVKHRDYNNWLSIHWDNGNKSYQPHEVLNAVEYRK